MTALFTFSPQQLIDCTVGQYAGNGCSGGSVYMSWMFYRDIGAVLNTTYPYTSSQGICDQSKTPFFRISGCANVPSSSELSLRNSLVLSPGVTVRVNGNSWGFLSYSGGVYDGSDCDDQNINHSMTLVGFNYVT